MYRFIAAFFLCEIISLSAAGAAPPHAPLQILEQGADGSVVSQDWSGYAVTALEGSVTAVAGSWVVPTATCGAGEKNTGASFWVGIDGYTSATVEQTGTDADCSNGNPKYYAWYEFVPEAGVTITSIEVQPGDLMTASVTYDGTEFTAAITDERSGETFSISKAVPQAKRDSAEWIAEDNSYVFTDFGTALFGQSPQGTAPTCQATINGVTAPIGGFHSDHAIFLAGYKPGSLIGIPSALYTDAGSFSVQWQ
jgi:peptidase A4-like protein